ncbi:OLC1v1023664C1 [Oldenlandia corymbosa var. corymbosa]|uniref:OLC1v1023664C1 n=1 Tax=Oldenlandia corymbosa var. corymbosa TaxID=529605 RepID=A0AAV1C398_OLDCO|nr:OLC1v1023664C1 [Oldenlandia corymbosa var. corymbosa]
MDGKPNLMKQNLKGICYADANSEDRLCNLPDLLLSNILSCLSIQEATRSSVLSRSWVDKWTAINKLKILYQPQYPEMLFLKNVEKILGKVSCIKEVELSCCSERILESHINALLSVVLKCESFRSLFFEDIGRNVVFSSSLFGVNLLTKLVLRSCRFAFSADICFHHLRSLKLNLVLLENSDNTPRKIFFNMPVLEEFESSWCTFFNVKSIKIDPPLLASFEMTSCKYYDNHFRMHDQCVCGDLWVLDLSSRVMMALQRVAPYPFPMFDNLKHVKFSLLCGYLHITAVELLQNTPHLEMLIISSEMCEECRKCTDAERGACISRNSSWFESGIGNKSLPANFLAHLKMVRFEYSPAWDLEIFLVKFLLMHASVLEELRFPFSCAVLSKEIEDQFLLFPGASSPVSLVFYPQRIN